MGVRVGRGGGEEGWGKVLNPSGEVLVVIFRIFGDIVLIYMASPVPHQGTSFENETN